MIKFEVGNCKNDNILRIRGFCTWFDITIVFNTLNLCSGMLVV